MNSSSKSFLNGIDAKLNSPNKITTLNPNAAEFVPSALRSFTENKIMNVGRVDATATSVKPCLDRSESNVSNNSDDEAHQFWRRQLPDDITPDFKIMGEEGLQASAGLSLAGLSINDGIETSRLSMTIGSQFLGKQQEIPPQGSQHVGLSERMTYPSLCYSEDSSTALMNLGGSNPWDKQFMNGDRILTNSIEGDQYARDSSAGFLSDLLNEHAVLENGGLDPVELLASHFPGFAVDSLAEIYYANGCDLQMTTEILTQLELQVDNGLNQNVNSKTLSAPSLSALDFPALSVPDSQDGLAKYSGEDLQQSPNALRSVDKEGFPFLKSPSSGTSRSTPDFVSAVRRLASQDSGYWKNERNCMDVSVGSSRNSQAQLSAGVFNGHGKGLYADKLQYSGTIQTTPSWLETGDSVAQIYSESREEARDLARVRNTCFEQARQAYIIGNKALAKELSAKGQLYNMQMKEAHEKAKESIYRQRNPVAPELQLYSRGKDPLIDLHGLHVNEAINVLKHELNILKRTARSSGQRLQVMICVGTGHHTKGSRTPVRLPVAVQRYLLDEMLQFSEDQPGLLRVVIR